MLSTPGFSDTRCKENEERAGKRGGGVERLPRDAQAGDDWQPTRTPRVGRTKDPEANSFGVSPLRDSLQQWKATESGSVLPV